MFTFISHDILFFLAVALTLFVPGFLLLRGIAHDTLTALEHFVFAVPLSFAMSTLLFLILAHAGMPLTRGLILLTFAALIAIGLSALYATRAKRVKGIMPQDIFSTVQKITIITLLAVTILVKATFLTHTIFPTTTDLGHHMFWVQKIVTTHTLPTYTSIDVVADDLGNAATSPAHFTAPITIPDFIIGEHIVLALIALLSGIALVSAMPSLVLFIVHFFTILALFLLALRIYRKLPFGTWAAIGTLLLIGPLYAISGAEAKFVSGGVIGNIIGNLLLVSFLYFLYRALTERSRSFFFFTTLLGTALVYTHHLSVFVLGYSIVAILLVFLLVARRNLRTHLLAWWHLVRSPAVLGFIALTVVLLLAVHTPSYLNADAISSSVGTPEKSTRTGVSIVQLMFISGEARFVLGVLGVFGVLVFLRSSKDIAIPYMRALLLGWPAMLFLMDTMPGLLHINIISTRIATYTAFPLALLGGFGLAWLAYTARRYVPFLLFSVALGFFLLFIIVNGLYDSNVKLTDAPKTTAAVQTFDAATYLATRVPEGIWTLKDHNYIVADTWVKVFLHRDYSDPLSRSYFRRYESTPGREHCTYEMITNPASPLAQSCFDTLYIGPIVVDTREDAVQFRKDASFARVYQNDAVSIFWRMTQQ